jgi:alkanesulfonate monooxygenase SsuD/methylene tetrahydromethanopterin reductase-like flavin-dependent oxidoreductase (luciferase family)
MGAELVDAVERFPCRIDDDEDSDTHPVDLTTLVRLARTAQRGAMDYLIVDDTLAGNPPFSGRRRDAFEAMRLAVRLAPKAHGMRIAPRVHSAWIEPARLLNALVRLELAAGGHLAWQLDMPDHPRSQTRGPELLAAIVKDVWAGEQAKSGLAAMARAHRARRMKEGLMPRRPRDHTDDAGPLLLVRARTQASARLGARHADLVRIAAANAADAAARRRDIRAEAERAGRDPSQIAVVADLTVCLNSVEANAMERAELIEAITDQPLGGDSATYVGTPEGLVDGMARWLETECCDGFTLLPASLPIDLVLAVDLVLPDLRGRGLVEAEAASSAEATSPAEAAA